MPGIPPLAPLPPLVPPLLMLMLPMPIAMLFSPSQSPCMYVSLGPSEVDADGAPENMDENMEIEPGAAGGAF
jgi:hypothetical protein